MKAYRVHGYLLDAWAPDRRGGTGSTGDWTLASRACDRGPTILAGGLRPDNVGDALAAVRPYGVDVSSGVEHVPGRKDEELVRAFVRAAREADAARPREAFQRSEVDEK